MVRCFIHYFYLGMVTPTPDLSIIIPTYNERGNVAELVKRIKVAMQQVPLSFELIFIDDHSKDGTVRAIKDIKATAPLFLHSKKGERGKAFSILEGFAYARGELIGFIDADLQYPPEALPAMLQLLKTNEIVVAERSERHTSLLRTVFSRSFRAFFGSFLLGFDVDMQSGLKVFRRSAICFEQLQPSAWGLDFQLLYWARRNGARLAGTPIIFAERSYGESAINPAKVALELGWGAIQLRYSGLKADLQTFFAKRQRD